MNHAPIPPHRTLVSPLWGGTGPPHAKICIGPPGCKGEHEDIEEIIQITLLLMSETNVSPWPKM